MTELNKITVWDISTTIDNDIIVSFLNNNYKNKGTKLLNLNKNIIDYDLIEKYVYNIALFHFNRLNIDIVKDNLNNFVEFWWKNEADVDNFHLDCDEYIKNNTGNYIHPMLSCVTYFNNHNCPTIITNIDFETYKYKDFNKLNSIYMSFPCKNKHITFDSTLYHGISNIFNNENYKNPRYMLAINLWSNKPTNIEYYDNSINSSNTNSINSSNFETTINKVLTDSNFNVIKVNNEVINFKLFENLLYKRDNNLFKTFSNFINENEIIYKSCIKLIVNDGKEEKQKQLQDSLKNKYGNIIDDINNIMSTCKSTIKYNRFLQRFQYNNIYSKEICNWIVNECELYAKNNGGWTTKRHDNYPTTDLPIDMVKPIFNFIYESFKTINNKIKKSYCLPESINLDFKDIFVVKYKFNEQNYLDLHEDGSFMSFQILLSNLNDFEGGGTYFDDGLTMYPEQGDLLIHSSKIKHCGLPITKGTRYLLVGFINLNLSIEEDNTNI